MKKKILAIIFSSLALTANAGTQITFYQSGGSWELAGYKDGTDYFNQESQTFADHYNNEISQISAPSREEQESLVAQKELEYESHVYILKKDKVYIDRTLSNLNKGMTLDQARSEGMSYAETVVPKPDYDQPYNTGMGSVKTNALAKINDFDCDFTEVYNYASPKYSPAPVAFAAPDKDVIKTLQVSSAEKKVALEKTGSVDGVISDEDKTQCDMLSSEFEALTMPDIPDLGEIGGSIGSIVDSIFGGGSKLAGKAASAFDGASDKIEEQLKAAAEAAYTEMTEGMCKRMRPSNVAKQAEKLVEGGYKTAVKDTGLSGTSIGNLDSERGQNNFTYKLIKNQTELSDSRLIKAVDVTREDQSKHIEKAAENAAEDRIDKEIDDLIEQIFG